MIVHKWMKGVPKGGIASNWIELDWLVCLLEERMNSGRTEGLGCSVVKELDGRFTLGFGRITFLKKKMKLFGN